MISNRALWLGIVLYAALFATVAVVVGGTAPPTTTRIAWEANSAGTLIFGNSEQTGVSEGSRSDYFLLRNSYETQGALTLRSQSVLVSSLRSSRSISQELVSVRAYNPRIADAPWARVSPPRFNAPIVSGGSEGGITAPQLAFADQSGFTLEEIGPVSEPATWLSTALITGVIAWSQRRRFIRSVRSRARPGKRAVCANRFWPILAGPLLICILSAPANLLAVPRETNDVGRLESSLARVAAVSKSLAKFHGSDLYQTF